MNTLAALFTSVAAVISILNYCSKGKMNLMAGGSVVAAAITAILAIILKIQGA
jgi:xanthine/uracil permease